MLPTSRRILRARAMTSRPAGVMAAVLLSRVMSTLLYGVSATDPVTYLAVAAALVGVAAVASLIPALRAAGVDPSRALRAE